MIYVKMPDQVGDEKFRLPFYLAMEEWVARHLPAGNYFFSWRVDPTVICGRNQEIDKEVNLNYCKEHGIDVVRRKSGGGCVYADRQNFMFSFITASDKVVEIFAEYTSMIASQLRKLGFDAVASGRNDIQIGERKVSGNAFYHIPGRSIAHGTMLYDFDPGCLANAITPSKAKLESKGVKSVPMRVTCLKNEGIKLSPEEFQEFMINGLTDGEPYVLTEKDISEIKEIEEGYYDPSFLRIEALRTGKNSSIKHIVRRNNIKGLGEFNIEFDIIKKDEVMKNFTLSGDFFMRADIEKSICSRFEGLKYDKEEIRSLVESLDTKSVIPGLEPSSFYKMIRGEQL